MQTFDRILAALGVVIAALTWFLPTDGASILTKALVSAGFAVAVVCVIVARVFITNQRLGKERKALDARVAEQASVIRSLEQQMGEIASAGANAVVTIATTMDHAMDELLEGSPTRLRMLSYVGNTAQLALRRKRDVHGLVLQLLVRDPRKPWRFPESGSRHQERRKREAESNREQLMNYEYFAGLAHRLAEGTASSFVRYYDHEPQCHAAVADYTDGSQRGFMGFYYVVSRDGQGDYTAGRGPVIGVTSQTELGKALLGDFVSWFDHYWEHLAIRP